MQLIQTMGNVLYEACDEDARVLREFIRDAADVPALRRSGDRAMVVVDDLLARVRELGGDHRDRWTRVRAADIFVTRTCARRDVIILE